MARYTVSTYCGEVIGETDYLGEALLLVLYDRLALDDDSTPWPVVRDDETGEHVAYRMDSGPGDAG
jgi:hypothetical protein